MADKSKIEWCDASWNPIRGCSRVSEGCRNCYAERVAARFSGTGQAYEGLAYRNASGAHWTGEVRLVEEHLNDPIKWKRPRRIFVNSMSDLFHESLDDFAIAQVFAVMACAQQHIFQVLTKRPERMNQLLCNEEFLQVVDSFSTELAFEHSDPLARRKNDYRAIARSLLEDVLPNVWLGVSVEDQQTAAERIPDLLNTPAAVRWLSCEPLLGAIDLSRYFGASRVLEGWPFGKVFAPSGETFNGKLIHWVVVGGESGAGARPVHPDWVRSLRDQCQAAGVAFFFKQWGEWLPVEGKGTHYLLGEYGDAQYFNRVGKKAAGRLLDGREWNEYPRGKEAA